MQGGHEYTVSIKWQSLLDWIQLHLIITAVSAESILLEFLHKTYLHPLHISIPKEKTNQTQTNKKGKKPQENKKPDQQVDGRMGVKWPPGSHPTSSVAKPKT